MSTGSNGTCTWTWDGTYWTCVDHCSPGFNCADAKTDPTSPSRFLDSDGKPLVSSIAGLSVKHIPGTKTWMIPDDIFQSILKKRGKSPKVVTAGVVATPPETETTSCI
jgi:hypothetical protein